MPQAAENTRRIEDIREQVVGMYTRHPWPSTRQADEEMGWRLRMLGVSPEDFRGKRVIELGCGTGEYALWYATNGAASVTGVDLSEGSLALAEQKRAQAGITNATFRRMDVLNLEFPDDSFDYAYSVGVLHHTGDPARGFRELSRVTKPGGIVIVSLYSSFSRLRLRWKQALCRVLGGDDIDRRARIGRRLFFNTMRKMNKRYHETNYELISYDIFGFPHESLHSGGEVLRWFDDCGVDYIGSFAPLRMRDYLYAFALPEYRQFRATFAGYPIVRAIGDGMSGVATTVFGAPPRDEVRRFPRPGPVSRMMSQVLWFGIGDRINCFTLAGRKRAR